MTNRHLHEAAAALVVAGVLALSGCGSARYPAYYTLTFAPGAQAPAPPRGLGSLAIRDLRCADYLCDGRIVYRPTPNEVGFYEFHRWAVAPRAMIARHLAERVRSRPLFTSVSGEESRVAADFVLTGTLERFEEVDEGRQVAALCTLSAQIVDTRRRVVVWRGAASERAAVDRRDVGGVVDALGRAVQASIEGLVADMERELAQGVTPGTS